MDGSEAVSHFITDMAVNVQRECYRVMAQGLTEGFRISSMLKAQCGECVPEIMKAVIRTANFLTDPFEVVFNAGVDQGITNQIREHKAVRIGPGRTGFQLIFCLVLFDLLQQLNHLGWNNEGSDFPVFRFCQVPGISFMPEHVQLRINCDLLLFEIYASPAKTQTF